MSHIDFCVFDHIDARGEPLSKLYDDRLCFAAAVEAAGFDGYYVAEHHSTPLGNAPSPSLMLAALTQRTNRIRIGSMVHVLPTYNPLRLAEEICMLDHMSGGRLDIGVGRGASPYEVGFYGVNTQQARPMFEEALEIISTYLRTETTTLSHRGDFYRYYDVPLTMRPLQPDGPPLWYGAFSERNLEFAARHGLNITLTGPPKRLRELSDRYREIWAEDRHAHLTPRVACMYQLFVGESDAEAERVAESAYKTWYGGMTHLWSANNSAPRASLAPNYSGAAKIGSYIAGSAQTVREKLQATLSASGITRVLLQCNMGDMPHEVALESLERFRTGVMPHFTAAAKRVA